MTLHERTYAFGQLGDFLSQNDPRRESMLQTVHHQNGWFTIEQTSFALNAWAGLLQKENLEKWLSPYSGLEPTRSKRIGLVLAGNIPMVGFHDILSVMIAGHHACIKLSSQDKTLIPYLLQTLVSFAPEMQAYFSFVERLENIDAVIATGSGNSSRYFEHYFGKYPHIIRKNRNSVAILTGNEQKEDFLALAEDIFRYYGLGCRNVSKVYAPRDYHFGAFFEAIESYQSILDNHKYNNNYDYNRTLLLLNNTVHWDNRFLMISENEALASPMASLHVEYYDFLSEAETKIQGQKDQLQCVVAQLPGYLPFGETQKPALWDYADGLDTLAFLSSL